MQSSQRQAGLRGEFRRAEYELHSNKLDGLHDPRVDAKNLCKLVPDKLPSGMQPLEFEACSDRDRDKDHDR